MQNEKLKCNNTRTTSFSNACNGVILVISCDGAKQICRARHSMSLKLEGSACEIMETYTTAHGKKGTSVCIPLHILQQCKAKCIMSESPFPVTETQLLA